MGKTDLRDIKRMPFPDKAFAFLFAVSPILLNYRGPFINAGVTLLVILVPYELLKILNKGTIPYYSLKLLAPMALFWAFKIVDHGTSVIEIGQVLIYVFLFLSFATWCIDPRLLIRYAVVVSCVASVCIIIQSFCYYVFNFHLQMVPTSLFLSSAEKWIKLAQTGRYSITGKRISFYRPSAFFLEPSHMFIYLLAPLYYELLSPEFGKREKRCAILISVGMILSTSGIGILATAAAWMLFLAKHGRKDDRFSFGKLLSPRNAALLLFAVGTLLVLYTQVDFFHKSIARIFSSSSDYSNAVSGRVSSGFSIIRQFSLRQLLLGVSDHYSEVEAHMTGFNATMYKFGIIGTALSYVFYIRCVFQLKNQFFWIALLLIGTSFFNPHTHGTIYMLFFVVFLMEGYRQKREIRHKAVKPETDIPLIAPSQN